MRAKAARTFVQPLEAELLASESVDLVFSYKLSSTDVQKRVFQNLLGYVRLRADRLIYILYCSPWPARHRTFKMPYRNFVF